MRASEDMLPIPGATGMPERCECGARLAPEPGVPGGGVYHARPLCTDCFKDKLERDGSVPKTIEAEGVELAPEDKPS
jgi:hypothetical protein